MGQHDYARLAVRKRLIFAPWELHPFDGGLAEFRGIGYTVMSMHQIQGYDTDGQALQSRPDTRLLDSVRRPRWHDHLRQHQPMSMSLPSNDPLQRTARSRFDCRCAVHVSLSGFVFVFINPEWRSSYSLALGWFVSGFHPVGFGRGVGVR
jgi:hypothetical protein